MEEFDLDGFYDDVDEMEEQDFDPDTFGDSGFQNLDRDFSDPNY